MKMTRVSWFVAFALAAAMMGQTSALMAQAPNGTRAIEQDWRVELYVMPEANRTTCPLFVSGFAIPLVPALFQCTWNHRDVPILDEGGIQLQAYSWNNLLDDKEVITPPWRERLSVDDEVITWTQRLEIAGMDYRFTVKNVSSKTWGQIPGPYSVKRTFLIWVPPLELYSFQEIAKNSGIIMGGNRFKKMTVVQTRFYDSSGNLLAPVTPEPPAGRQLYPPTPAHPSYDFVQEE
jgi:hypothetical protein